MWRGERARIELRSSTLVAGTLELPRADITAVSLEDDGAKSVRDRVYDLVVAVESERFVLARGMTLEEARRGQTTLEEWVG